MAMHFALLVSAKLRIYTSDCGKWQEKFGQASVSNGQKPSFNRDEIGASPNTSHARPHLTGFHAAPGKPN